MPARNRNRISREQMECARLAATGDYTQAMLAAYFGKSDGTIRKWLNDPRVMEEFRDILRAQTQSSVAKARQVLDRSMASDAGNGYLALQAAQTVLNRYDDDVMGTEKQEIVVRISGGMPELGMPKRAEDE